MNTTTINSYHMPELEHEIKSAIEKTEPTFWIWAERAALNDDPPLSNDDIRPYWGESNSFYQELQNEVAKRIPPKVLEAEMQEHQQATDRELQLLNNRASELKQESYEKEAALNAVQKPSINKLKVKALIVLNIIFLLLDAVITAPTFQASGFNLFESFCMALVFALIFFFGAHFFDRTVQRGKTPLQRRIIAVAYILILAALSFLIAYARIQFFNSSNVSGDEQRVPAYLSVLFVISSMGTFFIGVMIRRHSMPTPEQRKALEDYEALAQDKADSDAALKSIEQTIRSVTEKNAEVQLVIRSVLNSAKALEDYIIIKAERALQRFKRHNTMFRPDKGRPNSFNDTTYPFTFKRFY